MIDCQSIGENLQGNLQRINDEIRMIFINCSRSIGTDRMKRNQLIISLFLGQVLSISTNINQQIYVLNEKIQAVLSLAFQNFHTIFEELNHVHEQFQVGFSR